MPKRPDDLYLVDLIAWRRLVVWTIVDRQMPDLIAYVTEMLCAEYPGLVEGLRGSA